MKTMKETDIGPILAATNCRFKLPLAYPDLIYSATKIPEIGEDRFVMEYAIFSQKHQKVAARGKGTIVTINYKSGHKVQVPASLRQRIEMLESEAARTP